MHLNFKNDNILKCFKMLFVILTDYKWPEVTITETLPKL